MSAQPETKQWQYDVILTSELPHYMTLEEMHTRLTTNIRKAFGQ